MAELKDEERRRLFRELPYDWTEVLKLMTAAMDSHPAWHRVKGSPLENDLPVRAAKVFFDIVGESPDG